MSQEDFAGGLCSEQHIAELLFEAPGTMAPHAPRQIQLQPTCNRTQPYSARHLPADARCPPGPPCGYWYCRRLRPAEATQTKLSKAGSLGSVVGCEGCLAVGARAERRFTLWQATGCFCANLRGQPTGMLRARLHADHTKDSRMCRAVRLCVVRAEPPGQGHQGKQRARACRPRMPSQAGRQRGERVLSPRARKRRHQHGLCGGLLCALVHKRREGVPEA